MFMSLFKNKVWYHVVQSLKHDSNEWIFDNDVLINYVTGFAIYHYGFSEMILGTIGEKSRNHISNYICSINNKSKEDLAESYLKKSDNINVKISKHYIIDEINKSQIKNKVTAVDFEKFVIGWYFRKVRDNILHLQKEYREIYDKRIYETKAEKLERTKKERRAKLLTTVLKVDSL